MVVLLRASRELGGEAEKKGKNEYDFCSEKGSNFVYF